MTDAASSSPSIDAQGWFGAPVERIPTRNFGYEGEEFRAVGVLLHVMEGYRSTMDRWARESATRRRRRSVHLAYNRAGGAAQYVPLTAACWGAGKLALDEAGNLIPRYRPTWTLWRPEEPNPNHYAVQVEFEGFAKRESYGFDYLYGHGTAGTSHGITHRPWPDAMLDAAAADVWAAASWWEMDADWERTIGGHYEINPRDRAFDPGPAFPWKRFRDLVDGCRRASIAETGQTAASMPDADAGEAQLTDVREAVAAALAVASPKVVLDAVGRGFDADA